MIKKRAWIWKWSCGRGWRWVRRGASDVSAVLIYKFSKRKLLKKKNTNKIPTNEQKFRAICSVGAWKYIAWKCLSQNNIRTDWPGASDPAFRLGQFLLFHFRIRTIQSHCVNQAPKQAGVASHRSGKAMFLHPLPSSGLKAPFLAGPRRVKVSTEVAMARSSD